MLLGPIRLSFHVGLEPVLALCAFFPSARFVHFPDLSLATFGLRLDLPIYRVWPSARLALSQVGHSTFSALALGSTSPFARFGPSLFVTLNPF